MIDNKTTNRDYPLPNADNKLREDVVRLNDAFVDIDTDINGLYGTTGTLSTELATVTQNIQNGNYWHTSSTGNGAAYQVVLNPAPAALSSGLRVHMKAHVQNTGLATLNVNSLGIKTIKKTDGSDLKSGDISEGAACFLFYDGTNFQLINPKTDQAQNEVNTSNIMRAFEEIQENHGGSLLMETGWSDSFSNPNEQGADEAGSSGHQHDPTNNLYKGTDPGTDLNSDKNYDIESNFLQQEWDKNDNGFGAATSQATVVSGTTVTISTDTAPNGKLPANCENGRISFDSGTTWYDIKTKNSDTQITLDSAASNGTFDYLIRLSNINNGSVVFNSTPLLGASPVTDLTIGDISSLQYKANLTDFGLYYTQQSFIPTQSGTLETISFVLEVPFSASPTNNSFARIFSATSDGLRTGSVLATSNNRVMNTVTSKNWYSFTFSGSNRISLEAGTHYVVQLARDTGHPASSFGGIFYQYYIVGTYQDGLLSASTTKDNDGPDEIPADLSEAHDFCLKLEITPTAINPSNEYISICDTEPQKTDVSAWGTINSSSVTEWLNSGNSYYWLSFDPISNFGDGTEIKIGNIKTGDTIATGQSDLAPDTAIGNAYINRTFAAGNNEIITHIGLRIGFTNTPNASIKIFKENSVTDFDVLYTENITPVNNSGAVTWYELETPFRTPSKGLIRLGAWLVGGTDLLNVINAGGISGDAVYWNQGDNLAVGNYTNGSVSWIDTVNRLCIGYKTGTYDTGWRTIAKNESNVWKYNNSSSGFAFDPVTATTNDMLHAISEAIASQPANRMTKKELELISDSDWTTTGGWSASTDNLIRGVTLYSTTSEKHPFLSQYRLNYNSERGAMDLRSKNYDPGFIPSEGYVWSQVEHSDSDGSGTFYVSRNGGTEWTATPMTQQGLPLTGDIRIYRGTVDVSGQASGQDLRCRFQTEQGKDQFIHSWGLQAKS